MKKEQIKKIVMFLVVLVVITAFGSFTLGTEHAELSTPTKEEVFLENVDTNLNEDSLNENNISEENIEDKDLNSASDKILTNITKKDKRIAELTDKYNDEFYGTVAYYLEVIQKYSLPICFIGLTLGFFNFLIIGNKKLDKKEQGFGWIVGFTIGLVVFNVIPLIFALFVAGR